MKAVWMGDIHGYDSWKQIVEKEKDADLFGFIGDYFDSFTIGGEKQINNFLDIIAWKQSVEPEGKTVVMLTGNHDDPSYVYDGFVSGYQTNFAGLIKSTLEANKEHKQMAYAIEDVLFTHAGVGEYWLEKQWESIHRNTEFPQTAEEIADFVNQVWKHRPLQFQFTGYRNPYGDEMSQTPIWIRPNSLMRGNQLLKKKIVQVVGHTGMSTIDIEGKATGKRYFFIDTMGVGEYLILENHEFKRGKL